MPPSPKYVNTNAGLLQTGPHSSLKMTLTISSIPIIHDYYTRF